nr:MAG TPA: hypothetical protein [Caudoviricetes sp.]
MYVYVRYICVYMYISMVLKELLFTLFTSTSKPCNDCLEV